MSAQSEQNHIVLILVHGTFASAAPWTQEGSRLREILVGRLPGARCEPFEWSGKNSHHERLQAGKALGVRVRELCAADPNVKCFILAHSHGGNVALYALKDQRTAESVTGVVTIATPFLHFRPRSIPRAVAPLFALAYVAALSIILTLASSLVSTAAAGLWLAVGASFLPAAYVVFGQASAPARVYRRFRRAIAKRQNDVVQRAPWPVRKCSMLNLQISFDEARLYLSMLGAVGQAAITPLPALVLLGPALGGVGLMIAGLILMPMLAVAASVGMILRGHRFGFGQESALDHLVVDIRVSTSPFSNVTCLQQLEHDEQIPFAPHRFGFEHMLPQEKRHWRLLPKVATPTSSEDVETLHLTGVKRRSRLPGLRHSYLYDSDDIGKTVSNWILAKLVMAKDRDA